MPLMLDGVEIEQLFMNGAELDHLEINGTEIFTAFPATHYLAVGSNGGSHGFYEGVFGSVSSYIVSDPDDPGRTGVLTRLSTINSQSTTVISVDATRVHFNVYIPNIPTAISMQSNYPNDNADLFSYIANNVGNTIPLIIEFF